MFRRAAGYVHRILGGAAKALGLTIPPSLLPGLGQVWIACPCGGTFRRQVTGGDALIDLAELAGLN